MHFQQVSSSQLLGAGDQYWWRVPGQWTVQVPSALLRSRRPPRTLRRGLRGVHLKILLGFGVAATTSRSGGREEEAQEEEEEAGS